MSDRVHFFCIYNTIVDAIVYYTTQTHTKNE
jgi:hypothetical protein